MLLRLIRFPIGVEFSSMTVSARHALDSALARGFSYLGPCSKVLPRSSVVSAVLEIGVVCSPLIACPSVAELDWVERAELNEFRPVLPFLRGK